ncbi:hypothetical protein [Sphingomonas pituitosa]|uniref:hypothetical protein n=1 Tax=Sphingomonas pituitosa TaxID=99597 RepID=UPI00082A59CE|nr:hypothetical protein [Sphingomonas pituitosa]
MSQAEKIKRTLIGIEIPRDELACRLAEAAMGARRPLGATVAQAFAQMDRIDPGQSRRWQAAADAAVLFFHERIKEARQPS